MIVFGGKTNTRGENVYLEMYDIETREWKKYNSHYRIRHTMWAIDNVIYLHGGFENETSILPSNTIMKIDIDELLKAGPVIFHEQEISGRR
jgi:hypothetical protein